MKFNSTFGFLLLLSIIFTASAFDKVPDSIVKREVNDSTRVRKSTREVLTSQQLFVTELRKIKKDKNGRNIKFKAESRDAFKVISYDTDSGRTELDWVMCAENGESRAGLYYEGTPEYQKLDSLITKIKSELANKKKI